MIRERDDDRVNLVSRQFSESETENYLNKAIDRLNQFCNCLKNSDFQLLNQVTSNSRESLVPRIVEWIDNLHAVEIAKTPRVGSR